MKRQKELLILCCLPQIGTVVRKVETDVAVPSEITAYRTAVRTCYGNLKTAINAASDVDPVADLYQTSVGASQDKTVNPSSAVNTTSNAITISGHADF